MRDMEQVYSIARFIISDASSIEYGKYLYSVDL